MNTPKRFVAGAVCPSCKEMDKLMMWSVDNVPHRECMACGFTDTLNEQGLSVANELTTRVNQTKASDPQQAQPIRFFPNPNISKRSH